MVTPNAWAALFLCILVCVVTDYVLLRGVRLIFMMVNRYGGEFVLRSGMELEILILNWRY